jgi:hypothetical protein
LSNSTTVNDTQGTDEPMPTDCDQLKAAIAKTGDGEKDRQALLIKRAIELKCVEHIPDDWGVDING